MNEFLPMSDMVDRRIYRIKSRNLWVGVWDAANKAFIGIRRKFGDRYLFAEYHWETGPPYGTANAISDLGVDVGDEIPLRENLEGSWCNCPNDRRAEFRPDVPGTRAPGKWYHVDDGSLLDAEAKDYSHGRMNYALFELLEPFDNEALEERKAEGERFEQERLSIAYCPQTYEDMLRERRSASAQKWIREKRATGSNFEDVRVEFMRRLSLPLKDFADKEE